MSERILITGGVRSGKSNAAEQRLMRSKKVLYIATARCLDGEMAQRIARHRETRPAHWITAEASRDLPAVLGQHPEGDVLLDCVSNMVTNLMLDAEPDYEQVSGQRVGEIEREITAEFDALLDALERQDRTAVLVTNEVGGGLVSNYRMGRIFTDIVGRLNQHLAARCDRVILMACGLPLILKSPAAPGAPAENEQKAAMS